MNNDQSYIPPACPIPDDAETGDIVWVSTGDRVKLYEPHPNAAIPFVTGDHSGWSFRRDGQRWKPNEWTNGSEWYVIGFQYRDNRKPNLGSAIDSILEIESSRIAAIENATGGPLPEDHRVINPETGQQKAYKVLTADERAKGFVRPVRRSYVHRKCGTLTTIGFSIAETYARDPGFYSGTFCCGCRNHFPVGEAGEFVWDGTDEKVGT